MECENDSIRLRQEKWEHEYLSPYAAFSDQARGRQRPEPEDAMRVIFARDRDRIIHCKSFRRLKHKTQVFLAPEGDHYRTRLTHTLEVAQIARSIARALRMNEDLTETIALGHDLGHTPFGHAGERALNSLYEKGFNHCLQSLRVVDHLEKDGMGLNLTWEVRNGIVNHRTSGHPATREGQIVRISDKIAYINHDIDDAVRAGIFSEEEIPSEYTDVLGHTIKERLNTMITDVIRESGDGREIRLSPAVQEAMRDLRKYMFEHLYSNSVAKVEEPKVAGVIAGLYTYYMDHPDRMPLMYQKLCEGGDDLGQVVCDYVAGMSDQYAIKKFEDIYVPKSWKG
ncbi:MAG: deoxyguanosinetriphosphate triphosphohydrolase [Lachnospiraceae bacterium]|jgi:dGTPase